MLTDVQIKHELNQSALELGAGASETNKSASAQFCGALKIEQPQLFAENPAPFKMVCNNKEITKLNLAYAATPPGEVFIILGSSGYLELATNRGAASRILGVDRGAQIQVTFG